MSSLLPSRCELCAGRGMSDSKINHILGECSRGGARQRSLRIGNAIFEKGSMRRAIVGDLALLESFIANGRSRVTDTGSCDH
jgi:hypothetical protein